MSDDNDETVICDPNDDTQPIPVEEIPLGPLAAGAGIVEALTLDDVLGLLGGPPEHSDETKELFRRCPKLAGGGEYSAHPMANTPAVREAIAGMRGYLDHLEWIAGKVEEAGLSKDDYEGVARFIEGLDTGYSSVDTIVKFTHIDALWATGMVASWLGICQSFYNESQDFQAYERERNAKE